MSVKNKSGNIFNRVKRLLGRYFILVVVILIFAVMLIMKSDMPFAEKTRGLALDIVNPVIKVISYPAQGISYLIETASELSNIREENIRLKEENKVLIEWRNYAQSLEGDLERLIKTTNYVPPPEAFFVTAKIIADSGSALSQTVIVIAGKYNGVKKDMIAITDEGVVGRVLYAGANTSRILLLNDIKSRVPVVVGENKLRAMLTGNNKENPSVSFLPLDSKINVGDKIMTSGIGGIFPPDLNVGTVIEVTEDEVIAELSVDRNLLSFVKLVDYKLEDIYPEKDNKQEDENIKKSIKKDKVGQ